MIAIDWIPYQGLKQAIGVFWEVFAHIAIDWIPYQGLKHVFREIWQGAIYIAIDWIPYQGLKPEPDRTPPHAPASQLIGFPIRD